MTKSLMSMSIDLDDLWTYLKIQGNPNWQSYPSYLHSFIPYFLDLLDKKNLKITFFIVGKDASFARNQELLQEIVHRGHEIANHSFNHCLCNEDQLKDEVVLAEEAIYKATGYLTRGFRGPGFTWSNPLFNILSKRGYIYDSSTLPSYLLPLARWYYFWVARIGKQERQDRDRLFGRFRDGLRSNDPYLWRLQSGKELLEIPVTTFPAIKTPFHMSYLSALSSFSPMLAKGYLSAAVHSCRISRTAPNFLFHPTDFLDLTQVPEMSFFPGMSVPKEKKQEMFFHVIDKFLNYYDISTISSRALEVLEDHQAIKIKHT